MELSAIVVVRKISGERYLLVEDAKQLQLPSCLVADADAYAAAEKLLDQVGHERNDSDTWQAKDLIVAHTVKV